MASIKQLCTKCMDLDKTGRHEDAAKCCTEIRERFDEFDAKEFGEFFEKIMDGVTLENHRRLEGYVELVCPENPENPISGLFAVFYYGRFAQVYDLGRPDEALGWLDLSLEHDPTDEKALFAKGAVLEQYYDVDNTHNSLEDAVSWYEKAIALKPEYYEAHYNKGMLFERLGRHDEALECLDEVIRLDPGNAMAFDMKGNIFNKIGRKERAIECYRRAIRINPDFANAMYNLGSVLYYTERVEEASELLERAAKIDPGLPYLSGIREMIKGRLEFKAGLHGQCGKDHEGGV